MKTLLTAILCAATSAYSAITVQPSTLGNLFLTTEAVSIPITATVGSRIDWVVTDYFGNGVSSGSVTPAATKATVVFPWNRPGWFALELKEWNGTTLASTLVTSFGIVTPVTVGANSPFGVMSHFAQFDDQSVIPLLKKAGIVHLRDEQYWGSIELTKGAYTHAGKFVNYMAALAANGISPLIPLTFENKWYDYEAGRYTAPHTDNGRLGYANYAKSLLARYPEIKAIEGWNEYNAGTFIKGPATANKPFYYKKMIQKVWETIKPFRPDVKILAGGTVPIAHGFFKDLFAQGALPFCDAVSVHPYRTYPDGVELELSELRAQMGTQPKPVWATEFSYSGVKDDSLPERSKAASYLAQIVPLMLGQNVERMHYYLLMDGGSFPFRGLVGKAADARGKFRPHPVFIAYANLIRQLDGATFHSRFPVSQSWVYAIKFIRDTEQITALWSNHPVSTYLYTSDPVTITDIVGGTSVKTPTSGRVVLPITKDVQYVSGNVTAVAQSNSTILADSVSGYSKTSGQNGWSYGHATVPGVYNPSLFQSMTWAIWSTYNYRWLQAGASYPFAVGGDQMHPGANWAVRRWTSNRACQATLSGVLSRGAGGDGTGVRIFVDGVEVYSVTVAPSQVTSYSVPNVVLQVGSKVDFTVNRVGEQSFDAVGFTSKIVRQ